MPLVPNIATPACDAWECCCYAALRIVAEGDALLEPPNHLEKEN